MPPSDVVKEFQDGLEAEASAWVKANLAAYQDKPELSAEFSVRHAPKGGAAVAGKKYAGGEFIPAEAWAKASPAEKAKVEGKSSSSKDSAGDSEQATDATLNKSAPKTATKPDAEHARVGVPAMDVPPPPGIPRLPNLKPKQRDVESRFADAFTEAPDHFTDKYLKALAKGKVGVAPNVFATDDVKMLNRDWNPSKLRVGEELDKDTKKAMSKYNTAVHQTANAIAKRAFLKHLDGLEKLPDGNPKKSVLVTNGGCAAGKGSTLSHVEDPDSPYKGLTPAASQVGAVWDAAGEQNATENEWILQECKKRGIKPTFAYVWAEPTVTWDAPDRGVIRRAMRKGRMVDARLFADSYAEGAKNMSAFAEKHKNDGTDFIFIDNRTKGKPQVLQEFPKETLKWKGDEIYKFAVDNLRKHAGELSKSLVQGGLAGETIWGPPKGEST